MHSRKSEQRGASAVSVATIKAPDAASKLVYPYLWLGPAQCKEGLLPTAGMANRRLLNVTNVGASL